MKLSKKLFLGAFIVAVYVVHQDFWNWKKTEPLVFGVLSPGLAYHVAYSFLATLMMAVLVKFAWPKHLENVEPSEPSEQRRNGDPHP